MAIKLKPLPKKKPKTKAEKAFYEPKLNPNKIRTKPNAKMCAEKYFNLFGKDQPNLLVIYGIDDKTEYLVDYAWKNPEVNIVVSHPVEQVLANLNRRIGRLSFSMYRWRTINTSEFFEQPLAKIIVVAKEFYKDAKMRPNPDGTTYIILEDLF